MILKILMVISKRKHVQCPKKRRFNLSLQNYQYDSINFFESSFFPYCIKICNGLGTDMQIIDSYKEFRIKHRNLLR